MAGSGGFRLHVEEKKKNCRNYTRKCIYALCGSKQVAVPMGLSQVVVVMLVPPNGCCDGTYSSFMFHGGGYGCAVCGFGTAWGGHCGCPNYVCGCVKGADFSICGS